jgi:hypothetical protein
MGIGRGTKHSTARWGNAELHYTAPNNTPTRQRGSSPLTRCTDGLQSPHHSSSRSQLGGRVPHTDAIGTRPLARPRRLRLELHHALARPAHHPPAMEVDSPMQGHDRIDPDESMNTTITQSTIQALPDYNNYHDNGQHKENQRPQTSYSDTGFSRPYSQNYQNFTPSSDADTPPRYNYNQPNNNNNNNFQSSQASSKPPSRPPSAMSGTSQAGAGAGYDNGRANQYQEQQKNPKVIIKVGMVGDAQIGKTSLMVKYVEGSWDEDYIQTLGMPTHCD